ncbi:MAG: hypothetical protein U0R44_05010 [Candidatus Micrarchaeia archaeon]
MPGSHPYRELERPLRGPLSFGEKAKAALIGLRKMEPLLEIASRGLERSMPQSERLKYASLLGRSVSTERIHAHLAGETDSAVQEALAYAFARAYARKLERFRDSLCGKHSAMGAIFIVAERDAYSNAARAQAADLINSGDIVSSSARAALESVAFGRAQV